MSDHSPPRCGVLVETQGAGNWQFSAHPDPMGVVLFWKNDLGQTLRVEVPVAELAEWLLGASGKESHAWSATKPSAV